MNFKAINTAILKSTDIPEYVTRDSKFYDYLSGNSVAYYYSAHLSQEKSAIEKKIIAAGSILNNKYIKTLRFINRICKENKIKFLLFKTYKYIPEVVDGDVDIIVPKKDFYNLLYALRKAGFTCFENRHLEAICQKEGFCKVEPRVYSSSRGVLIINEKKIWERVNRLRIAGMKIGKTTKEVDLLHLLVSILYNPNYLKLYTLLVYKKCDIKRLYSLCNDEAIRQDLKFLLDNLLTKNVLVQRFPIFAGSISFTIWWYKRALPLKKIALFSKFKLLLFFFYSKYLYQFFNKLTFKHQWPLD